MNMFEEIVKNISPQEISEMLINLNKFNLDRKKHIKKYYKLRQLHAEILESMNKYIIGGKYNVNENFNNICKDVTKETQYLPIDLCTDDPDDITILDELFIYKTHPKLKSVTEVYLEKNKFKNEDKIKLLNSMNNSYVGLFKVIDVDRKEGYVTYEDVFTKNKFKVIDISMSSTLYIDKDKIIYVYNRIITFDDISFGTGIHCIMHSDHKLLQKFIKNHKYNDCSDFSRCLLLYDLSKKDNKLKLKQNSEYGSGSLK